MSVLEEYSWNLQTAVTASLAGQHNGSSNISNGGLYQSAISNESTVMLTFSCNLGEMTKDVTLDDSSTVGKNNYLNFNNNMQLQLTNRLDSIVFFL